MTLKMEGPGSATTRPEANETARESFLASQCSICPVLASTPIWDRASSSIERLALVRKVLR